MGHGSSKIDPEVKKRVKKLQVDLAKTFPPSALRNGLLPNEVAVPSFQGKLFVGSAAHGIDLATLEEMRYTHVLNAAGGEIVTGQSYYGKNTKYMEIPAMDAASFHLEHFFDRTNQFLSDAVANKASRILVHCNMGVSRSPTIVAAFLMKRCGWDAERAIKHLAKYRKATFPNEGFLTLLILYEEELKGDGSSSSSSDGADAKKKKRLSKPAVQNAKSKSSASKSKGSKEATPTKSRVAALKAGASSDFEKSLASVKTSASDSEAAFDATASSLTTNDNTTKTLGSTVAALSTVTEEDSD